MMYQLIQKAVLDGKPRVVEKQIKEALWKGADPKEILERGLLGSLDGIEEIKCDSEEQITQTLACARAMKKGMECLNQVVGEELYCRNETVLIGTASGDLHDMGKNIVALYFRIAGFHVVDLGVDVSFGQFLKALAEEPDIKIVCISSLLKTSHTEVRHIIQTIRSAMKNRKLFLMVGGGSMSEDLAKACGADCYTETAAAAVKAAVEYLQ